MCYVIIDGNWIIKCRTKMLQITLNDGNKRSHWIGIAISFVAVFCFAMIETARTIGLPGSIDISTFLAAFSPFIIAASMATMTGDLEEINFSGLATFWVLTLLVVLVGQIHVSGLYYQNIILSEVSENLIIYKIVMSGIYTAFGSILSILIMKSSLFRHLVISIFSVFTSLLFVF